MLHHNRGFWLQKDSSQLNTDTIEHIYSIPKYLPEGINHTFTKALYMSIYSNFNLGS